MTCPLGHRNSLHVDPKLYMLCNSYAFNVAIAGTYCLDAGPSRVYTILGDYATEVASTTKIMIKGDKLNLAGIKQSNSLTGGVYPMSKSWRSRPDVVKKDSHVYPSVVARCV